MGFVPGLISLLLLSAITTYGGILVGRLRERHPGIHTVADVGNVLFGRVGAELFSVMYWVLMVLVAGSGTLTASIALQNISAGHGLCALGFSGIIAATALVVGFWARELNKVAFAGWIGMSCVWASVTVLTIAVLAQSRPAMAPKDEPVHKDIRAISHVPFYKAVSAVSTQVFSLMGNVTFYSIVPEMRNPKDFPKAVMAGQMFVILNYLFVGCAVYGKVGQYIASPTLGTAGLVFNKLCYSLALPGLVVSVVMYAHLAAKYIFVRVLRNSTHLTNSTSIHWTTWIGSYIGCLCLAFILAEAIPFFDNLLGLIGATAGSLFSIVTPGLTAIYLLSDPEVPGKGQLQWIRTAWRNGFTSPIKLLTLVIGLAIMAGGFFCMGGGLYGEVEGLIELYRDGQAGKPFACEKPK